MELIPIIKTSSNLNAVDGRTLHEFLEVGKDFSNWAKSKIEKYGFIENVDYEVYAKIGENSNGGRPSKEYIFSLDMAKEVSMVENNPKGREARQYFIKAEKTLSKNATVGMVQGAIGIEQEFTILQMTANFLNLSDNSRLGMVQRFYEVKGLDVKLLPSYTESKGTLKSASELLKDNASPLSAVAFNKLLLADGFLEERERMSSKGQIKKFKAISEIGLAYGENLQSPQNPKEVQPNWYSEKFKELMNIVTK